MYITVLKPPLEEDLEVGLFSAEIYFPEMTVRRGEKMCCKCLLPNRMAAQCTDEIMCLCCFKPGHRKSECSQHLTSTGADHTTHSNPLEEGEAAAAGLNLCRSSSTPHPHLHQLSFPSSRKATARCHYRYWRCRREGKGRSRHARKRRKGKPRLTWNQCCLARAVFPPLS